MYIKDFYFLLKNRTPIHPVLLKDNTPIQPVLLKDRKNDQPFLLNGISDYIRKWNNQYINQMIEYNKERNNLKLIQTHNGTILPLNNSSSFGFFSGMFLSLTSIIYYFYSIKH